MMNKTDWNDEELKMVLTYIKREDLIPTSLHNNYERNKIVQVIQGLSYTWPSLKALMAIPDDAMALSLQVKFHSGLAWLKLDHLINRD